MNKVQRYKSLRKPRVSRVIPGFVRNHVKKISTKYDRNQSLNLQNVQVCYKSESQFAPTNWLLSRFVIWGWVRDGKNV